MFYFFSTIIFIACLLVGIVVHFDKEIEIKKLCEDDIESIKSFLNGVNNHGPTINVVLSMFDHVKFEEDKGYSFFLATASVPLILIAFVFNSIELIMMMNNGNEDYKLIKQKMIV